jgi:hypothetical protein
MALQATYLFEFPSSFLSSSNTFTLRLRQKEFSELMEINNVLDVASFIKAWLMNLPIRSLVSHEAKLRIIFVNRKKRSIFLLE